MVFKRFITIFGIAATSLILLGIVFSSGDISSTKTNLVETAFAAIQQQCAKPGPNDPPATIGIVMELKDEVRGDLLVKKYSFKHVRQGTQSQGSGQSSSGFANFGNFVITKNLDHSTPRIMTLFQDGRNIAEINIQVCFGDSLDPSKYEIKLENSIICSYEQIADTANFPPMEEIEICWRIMETTYTPSDAERAAGIDDATSRTDTAENQSR